MRENEIRADIRWLDDPQVFRVNQLPAHSDHTCYQNYAEYEAKDSSLVQPLNGSWKFAYSINAASRPAEFYREDFDASGFDTIVVPGHIELAGYDKIHYINTMYPWEGHIYRRPAGIGSFAEAEYNPVGSYLTSFDLAESFLGKRVVIRFEGVEQAMYVWVNGVFVGYAEDSFTPSEFDLTPFVREKGNLLAVEVHKRSTAAFLEDQDFFRFFGIFRNVCLIAKPNMHIEDMWAKPEWNSYEKIGSFSLQLKMSGELSGGAVRILIKDADGAICMDRTEAVGEEVCLEETTLGEVIPWDTRNPYLYTLLLEVTDAAGETVEVVPYEIGFRRIEIRDRVIYLNGERLMIYGVNRHEWSAKSGRCISPEEMRWDMECMLRNHINAVRTCHYPDQIPWYFLCDKNGIYMMAETNLESHGSWQKLGGVEPSWNVPGSSKLWEPAVLDRAQTNFETFKNHTAILFWSLGNESYAGDAILAMNRYFKERDTGRLVHYEGVVHNRAYEDGISDVESRMYATPEQIEEYLRQEPKKPFLLCEYMHCMGNSLGGMKSYMDLMDKYEMYQGGFIWDFIDQALLGRDEVTGKMVLRYGGDFDDRPSDYEFSGDGIVFADRTEKPAMQEVRYYYGR